jgi:hypothetical protein
MLIVLGRGERVYGFASDEPKFIEYLCKSELLLPTEFTHVLLYFIIFMILFNTNVAIKNYQFLNNSSFSLISETLYY